MNDIITVPDLPSEIQSNELVETMVDGANAMASRVAPCLTSTDPSPTEGQLAEAKLVLIGAVKRWSEAGSGAVASTNLQAGPFGQTQTVDTRQRGGYSLWPSEIESLQDICKNAAEDGGAFNVDTVPAASIHLPWCSLMFGANYCSCGTDIAGEPIYEIS